MPEVVDEANVARWKEIATSSRWSLRVLSQVGDPADGSPFAQVNMVHTEKASDWCRGFLDASAEHMRHWADFAAPLKWHPDHVVTHTFRPTQTLARAAMESAAQAVWIMAPDDPNECIRRHLCLIRWDYSEYRKSLPADRKAIAREQDQRLLESVSAHFTEDQLRPPSYLSVLRETASVVRRDPDEVEAVWRASSGSAHGKRWAAHALQRVTPGEEYEPGQFRALLMPDPTAMTRALDVADALLTYGVSRFLQQSGADFAAAHQDAMQWLESVVPMRRGDDASVPGDDPA
ncbi:hypothetical protein ACHAAC_06805 [Aeromicrobium sp. CF4.19]|uniref:hypothetical protein n=1 Tax=Aeromicrobium sp. CF4.19 TaxID=3373082 RepID=UPI003EE7857E